MDTLIAQINASSSSIMTTLNSLNNPKSTDLPRPQAAKALAGCGR
jgi:hypothetical protein